MIDIDFIVQNHNKIQWRVNQMTPLISIFLALIIAFSCLFSQQGKYTRKSVSSLESVWVKQGGLSGVSKFDYATFDKFIDFYVEVERFDYNVLPNKMLKDFRSEARSKSEITPESLAEVLESTVVNKIISILNDPEVSQKRGTAMKDESAFQTFAATKAKSLGLTADELAVLMNSAYIYLPFISSMKQVVEGNDISIKINGGLIWWQVKDDGSGNVSVEQILSVETMATSSLDRTAKYPITEKSMYTKFNFGDEEWNTTPEQYAQNDAMLAFAKNLGVKTKKIDAFKLSAQIVEASGKKYGFPLGFREGVHLDDGFDLVEYSEDEEGNEIAQRVGFVRVNKTGDNVKDPTSFTYARQLLGSRQDVGGVVMEHPVLGLDYRIKIGMINGLSIPKEALQYGNIDFFEDDLSNAFGVDITFAYNTAPIIGISQTFLDMNMGFAMPVYSYNEVDYTEIGTPTVVPFIANFYGGVTKKLWFGSSNLSFGGGAGIESINVAGKIPSLLYDIKYQWSTMSVAFKFGADFEKMITPDLNINLGFTYKIATEPAAVTEKYTIEETEYEFTYTEFEYPVEWEARKLADVGLGGMTLSLGINYALGELPFNLFGFLDPFKKY